MGSSKLSGGEDNPVISMLALVIEQPSVEGILPQISAGSNISKTPTVSSSKFTEIELSPPLNVVC